MRIRIALFLFALVFATGSNAAQIYRCKTSQGGSYWSSDWCNKSGGFTVDMVTVPNGMSFQEQARMADQVSNSKQAQTAGEDAARNRALSCGAIDSELAQIWKKYENGQYVEVSQVGRDQIRTRELKARRANLSCETR